MTTELHSDLEQLHRQKARLEEDVARLMTVDQLTGLLNRTAFMSRVDAHFKAAGDCAPLSVMIEFGLSGLPRLTGSLGRHVGDYLVSALAARLHALAETSTLCCRLDHRSFAMFVPAITDPLEAMTKAKAFLSKLNEPIDWVDRKITMDIGAGVALSGPNERDANTLLQNSGLAYKNATERGGPGYAFFNPALAQQAKRRIDVQSAIYDALERQHFYLNYQPCFDAQSGELTGFEALLRLNHPVFGQISPAEFIPVAEELGLIGRIGAWVMLEACRTAVDWPQHLTVAVNVSAEQVLQGTLMTDIHNALELSSLPAYRLELEITESTMLGDAELVLSQLQALREMGCAIALDDFGTGFSSLSYLWKFPFSSIKIDRSFVQVMETNSRVRGMLSAIMTLGRNLGLKVTAEGIETETQAKLFQDMQCDFLQGFLLGKPMPQEDLAAVIMPRFAKQISVRTAPRAESVAPAMKLGAGFG